MSSVPSNTSVTDVRTLADTIRYGELGPEQRETLIDLLHSVGTAVRLAPLAQEIDSDAGAVGYLLGTWSPVERDFAALAATVTVPAS